MTRYALMTQYCLLPCLDENLINCFTDGVFILEMQQESGQHHR